MEKMFPRTTVAGKSLSRMIIGTNWILGYSHRSPAQDRAIKCAHDTTEKISNMLETFLSHGVDTLMAPYSTSPLLIWAVEETKQKTGKDIIIVDTPCLNVDDNAEGRREAEKAVKHSAEVGSTFCLIHHAACEQLVCKNRHSIDRLDDYTKMIRDAGMIPGLSAHMPEMIVYSDENGYDVETYIQIYNAMGFLMQVEIETVSRIIHDAKKPVMTIKPMAAGRCTPYVGLNFSWNTIRPQDMVTIGCMSSDEAEEDIEISMAAIEHRFPDLEKRASPAKQDAFGK